MSSPTRDDDRLADAWLRCALGRSISHKEHLRISFVLLRRYGWEEGSRRIIDGTRRNCEALGASERYDEALTVRWTNALAEAIGQAAEMDAESFIERHPDFKRSDLLGLPHWKLEDSHPR